MDPASIAILVAIAASSLGVSGARWAARFRRRAKSLARVPRASVADFPTHEAARLVGRIAAAEGPPLFEPLYRQYGLDPRPAGDKARFFRHDFTSLSIGDDVAVIATGQRVADMADGRSSFRESKTRLVLHAGADDAFVVSNEPTVPRKR